MREIKFRCWYNDYMFYSIPAINFDASGVHCVELNHDPHDFCVVPDTWTGVDDYVLMQFTGWHDRNGTEIYEGDVVQVTGAESGRMMVHVDDVTMMQLSTLYPKGTVMGNIYEHPELLRYTQ